MRPMDPNQISQTATLFCGKVPCHLDRILDIQEVPPEFAMSVVGMMAFEQSDGSRLLNLNEGFIHQATHFACLSYGR